MDGSHSYCRIFKAEADRLFPAPPQDWIAGLEIRLRPPVQTRAAYLARFDQILGEMDAGQG